MLSYALITRVGQNSLQAFYQRFSGHDRARMSDRQGADARRDVIPGQIVRFLGPGARALDQESSTSILRRATKLIQTPAPTVHTAPASYSGDLDGQRTTMKTER